MPSLERPEYQPPGAGPNLYEFVDTLLATCRALVECGCSSNRVELLAARLASSFGFEVDVIAIPTGIWVCCRRGEERLTELIRIKNWKTDLEKLVRIDDLVAAIEGGHMTFAVARARLFELASARSPYRYWMTVAAGCGASFGLVYLFNGSPIEILLATPIGGLVEILKRYIGLKDHRRFLSDFLCAAFVALYVGVARLFFADIDSARMVLSGIIVLVPGLVFLNAIHEIAQKNLVSGTAKLIEAGVIGISLALGVTVVLGARFLVR